MIDGEKLVKIFKEKIFEQLEIKTSWGRIEVKNLIREMLIVSLIEATKE